MINYMKLLTRFCFVYSHGFAFYAASLIGGDVTKYHSLIEDMVAQTDEIDDVILRFEGGLFTTAIVVDASYQLSAAAKKAPTISEVGIPKRPLFRRISPPL